MKSLSPYIVLWLTFACGGAASGVVPPFYPEPTPLPPASTAITPREIKVALPDGTRIVPGDFNETRSLNGNWKLSRLEQSAAPFGEPTARDREYEKTDFDDSAWDEIPVPLDWYRQYPRFRSRSQPYVKGTYRRAFDLSGDDLARGKRVLLHFGVIGYDATVFVNGREVGRHKGDFTPCEFDVTDAVRAGENRIALRVLTDFGPNRGDVPLATHVYGSQWGFDDIKGGLWQSVSLRLEPAIRFRQIFVTPVLADDSLRIDYVIDNRTGRDAMFGLGFAVSTALKADPNRLNAAVGPGAVSLKPGDNTGSATIRLDRPVRWSPDEPFLYYINGYIRTRDGQVVSARAERFGFRDFRIIDGKFHLNGTRIYLFGENFSSATYGGRGRTPEEDREQLRGRLARFRSLGVNILRPAHMPPVPDALELADEIGIMIYNEWGWSFTNRIDVPAFQENNDRELAEWLARDHNHPSVVMWSTGNEVIHKDRPEIRWLLDRQVDLVRRLDRQGRPVGSFSGSASWFSYGTEPLNTDFLDLHDYAGFFRPSWTVFRSVMDKNYAGSLEHYGREGRDLGMPYVIWECVGFSWGGLSDPEFRLNDIEAYARYARAPASWGKPNGIGLAGTIGLAAALDPERGLPYGRAKFGHRLLEQVRQDLRVDGFAPWFLSDTLEAATLWNQPVLPGIRNAAGLPPVNFFSGGTDEAELFAVNSTPEPLRDVHFRVWLRTPAGEDVELGRFSPGEIAPWHKAVLPVKLSIPPVSSPCPQIRITLNNSAGGVIGRNFYNVGIRDRTLLAEPLAVAETVALLDTGDAGSVDRTAGILTALSVPFDTVPVARLSSQHTAAILPAASPGPGGVAVDHRALRAWAREGGKLLILEQAPSDRSLLPGLKVVPSHLAYVDLAIPEHPVFAGLSQRDFDQWNNPDAGYVIDAGIEPFTTNAIAVRAPLLSSNKIENAVMEATVGRGRIFWTQLNATRLWGVDSSASLYLRNVLGYMLGGAPAYAKVKPLPESGGQLAVIPAGREIFIDLSAHANQGFADDGKRGGWTAQGPDDFAGMPTGLQELRGVPFRIIDPAANGGKSCLVLRGSERPGFPARIDGLPVNRKLTRLFFLHASAWPGDDVGRYRLHYEDGTHHDYLLVNGRNIGDWRTPRELPEATPVIVRGNRQGTGLVGVYRAVLENPHPQKKILTIDFLSSGFDNTIEWLPGIAPVPILVGITGELAP
ncbi:beta-galactosidase/beta-glucuronidase [Opitutaceae bacterium TAV1]|nr:beta-galactosidase/beta-glucuronidase [Opitutaceae bacterium TAV1]